MKAWQGCSGVRIQVCCALGCRLGLCHAQSDSEESQVDARIVTVQGDEARLRCKWQKMQQAAIARMHEVPSSGTTTVLFVCTALPGCCRV